MGRLVVAIMLLGSMTAFSQQLGYMRDFEKIDKDCYFLRFDTEEEAIRKHSYVLDMNGLDTNYTIYERGNNPIAFSYYKIKPNSNKVVVTFILLHNGKYDVWFMEVDDKDTHFADVIDNTGAPIELIYIKP
jgi:hypothetical protein